MDKLNKGISMPIGILIILICAIIGGTVFFWQWQKELKEQTPVSIVKPDETGEKEEILINGKEIGYIKAIYTESNKEYLDIDYIQYLSGEEAINAIKEDGQCPDDIYPNPSQCIPNGFYIRNQNPKIRTFEISKKVVVSREYPLLNMSYEDFKNDFQSGNPHIPFYITLVDSVIVEITEQFIP